MDNTHNAPDVVISTYDKDIDTFRTTYLEFFADHAEFRGHSELLELLAVMDLSRHQLYCATSDGVLCGVAAVGFINNIIEFDVFVVSEGFREIGVGDALFTHVVQQDRYQGAKGYESRALPGDRHTKNFFETRQGKARLLVVFGPIPEK